MDEIEGIGGDADVDEPAGGEPADDGVRAVGDFGGGGED